jgi:hypothetical protein
MSIYLVHPNKRVDARVTKSDCSQNKEPEGKEKETKTIASYHEHEVYSSILRRKAFQEIARRPDSGLPILDPIVTCQKVRLIIKDKDQELAELWQDNIVDNNPKQFDPRHIEHVSQYSLQPEGNCYKHHIKMKETPCTPWKECIYNDDAKTKQQKHDNKNLPRNIKRRKFLSEEEEQLLREVQQEEKGQQKQQYSERQKQQSQFYDFGPIDGGFY